MSKLREKKGGYIYSRSDDLKIKHAHNPNEILNDSVLRILRYFVKNLISNVLYPPQITRRF